MRLGDSPDEAFLRKKPQAWSLFSAKAVIRIIFRPDGSPGTSGMGPMWNRSKPALKRRYRGRGRPRHNVGRASSPVRSPKTAWKLAKRRTGLGRDGLRAVPF